LNKALELMRNGIFMTEEINDISKIEWLYRAKLAKAGYLFIK
jgi:hypothetical protein